MTERACACVNDDPYWCIALRYGYPRPVAGDDEACECVCHDEWHQAQEDEYEVEIERELARSR